MIRIIIVSFFAGFIGATTYCICSCLPPATSAADIDQAEHGPILFAPALGRSYFSGGKHSGKD